VRERAFWSDYMAAYEEAIRATASQQAPWFVVPADNKWFTRLVVAAAVVQALEELDLSYPRISRQKRKELRAIRTMLAHER
jgi:polyphosphate kinase 2 (PPK2 family)